MLNENFQMGAAKNLWIEILKSNYKLFTGIDKEIVDFLLKRGLAADQHVDIINTFCLDGYSAECVETLSKILLKNKEIVILPKELKNNQTTLFYNRGEGWGQDCVFKGIHNIIKLCDLKGTIFYSNHAYNLQEVYLRFCKKYKLDPVMECFYNGGYSFHNLGSQFYILPKEYNEVPISQKKLFCNYNWNAWPHRLACIALLHYHDLLIDGYVTSPGYKKFSYNDYVDWNLLYNGCQEYLNAYFDKKQILEKLKSLRINYPLKIDDRSNYNDTDTPLYDVDLKKPLFECRMNSLFELITETRFNGEHFFSEKTYMPIRLGKPFLMMSSYGALKSLRRIGYKTFSPFIDESYDDVKNDAHRLLSIIKELKRLQELRRRNIGEFYQIVENCNNIAQYNLEIFTLKANRSLYHIEDMNEFIRFMNVNL